VRSWLDRVMNCLSVKTTLRGVEVALFMPTSESERIRVFQKVEEALGTIEAYAPVRFAALRADLRQILVRGRPDCVASFDPERQLCDIYVGWLTRDDVTPEAIASTIVHEATHARLWRLGFRYAAGVQARIEQICYRAERVFGKRLPTGSVLVSEAQANMERLPQLCVPEAALERERAAVQDLASRNAMVVPILWLYHCRIWLRKRRDGSIQNRN